MLLLLLLLLLFLTFSALVANPEKLLYTVANPARSLLNREKKKKRKSLYVGSHGSNLFQHKTDKADQSVLRSIRPTTFGVNYTYKDV